MSNEEKIKKIVEDFLKSMDIAFDEVTAVKKEGDNKWSFVIKTKESGLLIGTRGAHIGSLNHLIKRIAAKLLGEQADSVNFYVDVNDYHERLVNEIKQKAQILAERARSFKSNVEMEPMPPYERMIVHSFFEGSPDITTESIGNGPSRRIVLKYKAEEKF